jgi:hypothetical protein
MTFFWHLRDKVRKYKVRYYTFMKGLISLYLNLFLVISFFTILRYCLKLQIKKFQTRHIVKPVYNDHFQDPKFVAVVDRWSLIRGSSLSRKLKLGLQKGGRCRQVVAIRSWSLAQIPWDAKFAWKDCRRLWESGMLCGTPNCGHCRQVVVIRRRSFDEV